MDEKHSLQMSQISIVILAAGQGARMQSNVPKVLFKVFYENLKESNAALVQ